MKRRKLQDASIYVGESICYKVKIEVGCKSQYDNVYNDFSITLPWGHTVHGDTAEQVVAKAKQAFIENGEQKPDKIIGVSVEGENHSWNQVPKEQSAAFVLDWDVGFRLVLRDGKVVYYKRDGKTRDYSWRWERELPWTQAAEDALLEATRRVDAARESVQALVASDNFQMLLETRGALALPGPAAAQSEKGNE